MEKSNVFIITCIVDRFQRCIHPGNPSFQPEHERRAAPAAQFHIGHPGELSDIGKTDFLHI